MPKSLHFIATHKFTTFFSLSARNNLQKKITQKNLLRKLVLSAFSSFFFLSLVCIDQNTKEMGQMKNPVYSMISSPRNENKSVCNSCFCHFSFNCVFPLCFETRFFSLLRNQLICFNLLKCSNFVQILLIFVRLFRSNANNRCSG